jgi:tetratricopeptide (TPR) repeat protein
VRDEFSGRVKTVLAQRAAGRCSNPACGAVTSGPGLDPDEAVNVGVAAHITAASSRGPRYDPGLTPAERRAASNGIWLCQSCAKLIDSDLTRYTVAALRRWKASAEGQAAAMLAAGAGQRLQSAELAIPSVESVGELLSFASTRLARVGRDTELAELDAFLGSGRQLSWWLWTGPAGAGKSRLAVELCRRAAAAGWDAGFLREPGQERLGDLQALVPTLVVVDYAAQRAAWLSEAVIRLIQRGGAPVRVLVLERAAGGPWWDTFRRLGRAEESHLIDASAHALPRELGGMHPDQLRALIRAVAVQAGVAPSSTAIEHITDRARFIDPAGRPLFAMIAALDWLDGGDAGGGRDAALRRLAGRLDAQTAERLAGRVPPGRVRNLRTFATALGGVTAAQYERVLAGQRPSPGLLPGLYDDYHDVLFGELADGVRPDILGELYVLDRLAAGDAEEHAAAALLRLAWTVNQDAYRAFVGRAAADHHEHPCLVGLLDAEDWSGAPVASARMAADVIPFLRRNDHPSLQLILARLDRLQAGLDGRAAAEAVAEARFAHANLVRAEGATDTANSMYTALLANCDPAWPVHAGILNNRGTTWLKLQHDDAAAADFTAVVDAATATDEARACALNNRADILEKRGDSAGSVADRTSVLNLDDTSYDRRYIAYSRRARTLWRLGEHDAALRDIEVLLATGDIVLEQKMAALLQRAGWLASAEPDRALADLKAIITSPRNFAQVEQRASLLLGQILGKQP